MLTATRHVLGRPRHRWSLLGAIKNLVPNRSGPVLIAPSSIDVPVTAGGGRGPVFIPGAPTGPGGGTPPTKTPRQITSDWFTVVTDSSIRPHSPMPDTTPPTEPGGSFQTNQPAWPAGGGPKPKPASGDTPPIIVQPPPPVYVPPYVPPSGGGSGGGGGGGVATDPTITLTPAPKPPIWPWAVAGAIVAAVGAFAMSR